MFKTVFILHANNTVTDTKRMLIPLYQFQNLGNMLGIFCQMRKSEEILDNRKLDRHIQSKHSIARLTHELHVT